MATVVIIGYHAACLAERSKRNSGKKPSELNQKRLSSHPLLQERNRIQWVGPLVDDSEAHGPQHASKQPVNNIARHGIADGMVHRSA